MTMASTDNLEKLVNFFEEAEELSIESRYESERDIDFKNNIQWTADECNKMEARYQAVVTYNIIGAKVNALLGLERSQRTKAKGLPRTPVHEDAAEAVTDSISFVLDNNEFEYKSSDVFEDMLVPGTGGAEVLVKIVNGKHEIEIKQYPWDRLFWDPHSRKRDFSDSKYKGSVIWMDQEDAISMAKRAGHSETEAKALVTPSDQPFSDTFDDKPTEGWYDASRKRVRIVSIWYREDDTWKWAKFTKNGFIKEPIISPFRDEDGLTECGLEMQSAYVDREGNRFGWVRAQIDPQKEINKRRSKALHHLSARQFRYEKGAVDDVNKAKNELAKPDGAIETNPNFEFEVLPNEDMTQGQLALYQDAVNQINNVAAPVTDNDSKVRSGRAEIQRSQERVMEIGPIFDGHRHFKKRIYRLVWNRIKQFWDAERWIRVTDDESNLKWVGLNRPVTVGEQLRNDISQLSPEQKQDPRFQQAIQALGQDPRMNQVVGIENPLPELDMDIILENAPDYPTIQQEQFDNLISVLQTGANLPLSDPRWQLIIKASQLRNKEEIIEFLKGDPEALKAQQAQAQAVFKLEEQARQAEVDKTRTEARENLADVRKKLAEAAKIASEIGVENQSTQ